MALEFKDATFEAEVLETGGVAVLDFWAPWCGPCKKIGPIIEDLHKEYDGKALIGKVNVDDNADTAMRYGVMSIPTIVILKDGVEVKRHVGLTTHANLAGMIEDQLKPVES